MHATHHDDVGIRVSRLACQRQRVTDEVGHRLDVARRVIVCQDHGVLLLAHPSYLGSEIRAFGSGLINETLLYPFFIHIHILYSFIVLKIKERKNVLYDILWIS